MSTAANTTNTDRTAAVTSIVSKDIMASLEMEAIILNQESGTLMRIKILQQLLNCARAAHSGRGHGLGARRIQQAHASRQDADHAVTFKLGEGTADRFNGQAEEIRNVLPAHRQRHLL